MQRELDRRNAEADLRQLTVTLAAIGAVTSDEGNSAVKKLSEELAARAAGKEPKKNE